MKNYHAMEIFLNNNIKSFWKVGGLTLDFYRAIYPKMDGTFILDGLFTGNKLNYYEWKASFRKNGKTYYFNPKKYAPELFITMSNKSENRLIERAFNYCLKIRENVFPKVMERLYNEIKNARPKPYPFCGEKVFELPDDRYKWKPKGLEEFAPNGNLFRKAPMPNTNKYTFWDDVQPENKQVDKYKLLFYCTPYGYLDEDLITTKKLTIAKGSRKLNLKHYPDAKLKKIKLKIKALEKDIEELFNYTEEEFYLE